MRVSGCGPPAAGARSPQKPSGAHRSPQEVGKVRQAMNRNSGEARCAIQLHQYHILIPPECTFLRQRQRLY